MGRYSRWNIRFKHVKGHSVKEELEQINKLIRQPSISPEHVLQGICTTFTSRNKECTEVGTSYADTSFHALEYLEKDLISLSRKYPELIFSAAGCFEDDPVSLVNAADGCLERNIPQLVYPGFHKIIYD